MNMKLVREYINEKFSEDSDPIKDMRIGTERINFQEAYDIINPYNKLDGWLRYLRSFVGKTISGKFKQRYEGIVFKEFLIIKNYTSLNFGEDIIFTDDSDNKFYVIKSEDYYINR